MGVKHPIAQIPLGHHAIDRGANQRDEKSGAVAPHIRRCAPGLARLPFSSAHRAAWPPAVRPFQPAFLRPRAAPPG